jgi:hypothetical protein
VARLLQAADVLPRLPVLIGECLKAAGISSGSGGTLFDPSTILRLSPAAN